MTCLHNRKQLELTPNGPHYGKLICLDCGAFAGWAPKPETIERAKTNLAIFERLRAVVLTDWEKEFLLSVEKQGRLSPKQQACLDKIAKQHGF